MQSETAIYLNRHSIRSAYTYGNSKVLGRRLETGDVLEPTDVYESTNGSWEVCPCPGLAIQAGADVVWIRPGA